MMLWSVMLAQAAEPISIREVVTLDSLGRGGRIPLPTDPVAHAMATGEFASSKAGGSLMNRTWTTKAANADGWFEGLRGYSFAQVPSNSRRVMVLEAAGHGMVYVNREPLMGDPYGYGYQKLPITLKPGDNEFLFSNGRGRLKATLRPMLSDFELNLSDATLPDLVVGDSSSPLASILVLSGRDDFSRDLEIEARIGPRSQRTRLDPIAPLTAQRIAFSLPEVDPKVPGPVNLELRLIQAGKAVAEGTLPIQAKKPTDTRKITFRSNIDGTVQYFAVVPPTGKADGLVLSLHGASVEALGQAQAYSPKPDLWIVCPTNRRPFGFDWEDWGRMDALEVLQEAQRRFKPNPNRQYLTGHSMGGHGSWSLGAHFPDLWAAVAPSAGWRSFFTYAGGTRPSDDWPDAFARTANIYDTELLAENHRGQGLFILHGDADDNVPVSEARAMKSLLTRQRIPFGYHEQPGAGHWWDGDRAPGADCLEWPELFETFKTRRQVWVEDEVRFTTINPAVSSRRGPIEILKQIERMKPSSVQLRRSQAGVIVKTENVRAMRIADKVIEIDGQAVESGESFERRGDRWRFQRQLPKEAGPLKEIWTNRPILVVATDGTPEENAWSYAKARYDAQQFSYRGNGGFDIVRDRDFKPSDRTVVVYGNARINSAWRRYADRAPGFGDGATLFWQPAGRFHLIGLGGATVAAMRSLDRLPIFVSGVGYPDWAVLEPNWLQKGMPEGVRSSGFWP